MGLFPVPHIFCFIFICLFVHPPLICFSPEPVWPWVIIYPSRLQHKYDKHCCSTVVLPFIFRSINDENKDFQIYRNDHVYLTTSFHNIKSSYFDRCMSRSKGIRSVFSHSLRHLSTHCLFPSSLQPCWVSLAGGGGVWRLQPAGTQQNPAALLLLLLRRLLAELEAFFCCPNWCAFHLSRTTTLPAPILFGMSFFQSKFYFYQEK